MKPSRRAIIARGHCERRGLAYRHAVLHVCQRSTGVSAELSSRCLTLSRSRTRILIDRVGREARDDGVEPLARVRLVDRVGELRRVLGGRVPDAEQRFLNSIVL